MPGRFELKPTLEKVWHAPDNFRFMDPLPPMHRRGIIIAAIVLVVGFLLPSDDTPNAPVVTREAQLDIQSQSQPPTEEQLRAQLVTPQNDPDQVAPVAPEPDQVAPVAPEPIQEGQHRKANQKSSRKPPIRNHSSQIAELIINGAPIVSNPVKRWRSCSATTDCPLPMSMPWRR